MPQELYTDIVDSLETGNCVLILGPHLSKNDSGQLYSEFFKELFNLHKDCIFNYFEKENLFTFDESKRREQNKVEKKIIKFYQETGERVLLEKIAQIKFPLIINTSPDISLNKVYEENEVAFDSDFFSRFKMGESEVNGPSKSQPVLYNIFGSVHKTGSIVYTNEAMYKTLEKLLPETSLPPSIESFLKTATSYLFLGFSYESWYYQLLCHKLHIKAQTTTSILSTPDCSASENGNFIMGKHFGMTFTADSPEETIDRVIKAAKDSDIANEEILREIKRNNLYGLFFSYKYKNKDEIINIENAVDYIEHYIKTNTQDYFYKTFRDKNTLELGDYISDFMNQIGKGSTIIQVISEAYLRSEYCMYEALKIKEADGKNKVYRIILSDVKFDAESLINYKKYWDEKYDEKTTAINNAISGAVERGREIKKLDVLIKIHDYIADFLELIADELNIRLPENSFLEVEGKSKITEASEKSLSNLFENLKNTNGN